MDKKRYSTTQHRIRRPNLLELANGTDLQEQGSSHLGTCCNMGHGQNSNHGQSLPAHIQGTKQTRHDIPSTLYLRHLTASACALCRENLSSPPANLSSCLALMPCYLSTTVNKRPFDATRANSDAVSSWRPTASTALDDFDDCCWATCYSIYLPG